MTKFISNDNNEFLTQGYKSLVKILVKNKDRIDYKKMFELTTKNGMPVDMAINSEFVVSDRNKLINENYKQLRPRIEDFIFLERLVRNRFLW